MTFAEKGADAASSKEHLQLVCCLGAYASILSNQPLSLSWRLQFEAVSTGVGREYFVFYIRPLVSCRFTGFINDVIDSRHRNLFTWFVYFFTHSSRMVEPKK